MTSALNGLNDQQREAVLATHGPVLILAGAGSGKTRALTHRIAHILQQRIASPEEILAVTFTNKAAQEMKERVRGLMAHGSPAPASIGTFHSIGARMLREQHRFHKRSARFVILDTKDSERIIKHALKEENLSLREWSPSRLRHRISSAKNALQTPSEISDIAEQEADEILANVYRRYEQLLASHDAYDFDDLLLVPVLLLEQQNAVRKRYQQQWKFISVDEYQDTNPLQEKMIQLLLGPDKNICAVGDDYQAIYSWRGANVDHILRFEQRYPICRVIYLTQNYRSTPQILEAANTVIALNAGQKHKTLWTQKTRGNPVELTELLSDRLEARWVREQISHHVEEGGKLNDCAILYRTNAQSRLLEEEFLTHRIPYAIVGGMRFYDRREIKDALAYLYFFLHPSSRMSFDRIADVLLDGIGPKTIDRWEQEAAAANVSLGAHIERVSAQKQQLAPLVRAFQLVRNRKTAQVSDMIRTLLSQSGYLKKLEALPDGEERLENIEELYHVASEYADLDRFLEDTALLSDIDTFQAGQDRVTCMTLHASKGLEFPRIFITGCEEGLLPHINSFGSKESLEEECRLMYVGMTRAQKRLDISYATQRYAGGEMGMQLPSRFLQELPEAVIRSARDEPRTMGIQELTQSWDSDEPVLVAYNEGDLVAHPQFGRGVVIGIRGSTMTCVFENYGVKTIASNAIAET